jgi:subtilase family serine protease
LHAQRNRITGKIDNRRRVSLKGHIHPKSLAGTDEGPLEASSALPYVTLSLKRTAGQEEALSRLLAEQQDPASPNYHRWLTPEEYAGRFGASQDDIDRLSSWLRDQGLSVVSVARARNWLAFSGDAAQAESAFGVRMRRFRVNGRMHYANSTEPTIPAGLEAVVGSIHGLNDFRMKSPRRVAARPNFTSSRGSHYLAPDDVATIYNIASLYRAGVDGSGQKIVIVGQTRIDMADIRAFRTNFQLPANDPEVILVPNTRDPGIVSDDLGEADLDIELAGAVARNANILYVYSRDVTDAAQYAIDQNLAPVMSMSYGSCESLTPRSDAVMLQSWARQANAQGMTWFAASGDAGGTDCDGGGSRSRGGLAVDLPASVPEVTGVGGTRFLEAGGTFWNPTNSAGGASALSYIQEAAWNDSTPGNPAASGGGASVRFPKPAWQTGAGVPADDARSVPDVALAASANHDGFLIYTQGGLSVIGGTSAGAPSFAGIAALLNHYLVSSGLQAGPGLGNMNPRLYSLAQSAPDAFHDITSGNNVITVTCSTRTRNCAEGSFGFETGVGYDPVTGLGSVDAYRLVTAWVAPPAPAARSSASVAVSSDGQTLTAVVTSSDGGTPTGEVAFFRVGALLGTAALAGSGATAEATLTVDPAQAPEGAGAVTAEYGGDAAYLGGTASVDVASA